jgi:hypothetical protein
MKRYVIYTLYQTLLGYKIKENEVGGYVPRMGKMRNAYKSIDIKSNVKRLLTRAKRRWEDSIKISEISGSYGGECEADCLLVRCAV